ncbi:dihydropteroate synthase [Prochlorococcus sp. MIT 1223]|uniref:dihydropteroate synthase n=1 Tax=Prochlorococcus sp. MIT 1223 TaxID=3096217 RepID=UPI002A75DEBF|nr:dihydropteroate synthase [Prochlorococcus sp. MIT 1223]
MNWPISWRKSTCIMGVLNITPDSFSDGGLFNDPIKAIERATELVSQGADVLDIGAQSTRPGSIEVGANIELSRLIPVLIPIRDKYPNLIISIDTFLSKVADKALEIGANWINDISGGRHDPEILNVVSKYQCPYVLTHSRGNSQTMNNLTDYNDLINDIYSELENLTYIAIEKGITKENIIWDPGLGFSKTTDQNIQIIRSLKKFSKSGYPLLIGPSKKRFVGEVTGELQPINRTFGTLAVICKCVQDNIEIVRVHDVKSTKKTILMASQIWTK